MSKVSAASQDLAHRLLASELVNGESPEKRVEPAVRVIEELRAKLIRLAGVHGFRSLLSRALTLAKAQNPALEKVEVGADGSLEGTEGMDQGATSATGTASISLVAHLLELLVTFIGAPLTLHLLREKWPDASIDEVEIGIEEGP